MDAEQKHSYFTLCSYPKKHSDAILSLSLFSDCIQANKAAEMVGSGPSKTPLNKNDDRIEIYVQGQDGIQVLFAIKRHLQLKKLLMKYCENKKLDYKSMKFIYKRCKLPVRNTPDELHMQDGDQIDAMVDAHSG